MSRSGYSKDCDANLWRGQVASAIRGKRGQKLLLDLCWALDAMPVKGLVADELETADGAVCALGALGKARGLDMSGVDPEDAEAVARLFNVAPQLAREVVYMNDEAGWNAETPTQRYERMKAWALAQIKPIS